MTCTVLPIVCIIMVQGGRPGRTLPLSGSGSGVGPERVRDGSEWVRGGSGAGPGPVGREESQTKNL